MKKGFTIIETLVAISLLLLAITGPMVFAQTGLRAAFNSRDQVTAFYLAQDAIEFVKNRRDHNILDKTSDEWLQSFDNVCESVGDNRDGGCSVDTSSADGKIERCSFSGVNGTGCLGDKTDASKDNHLKIDSDGILGHGPGTNSVFSRTVYVDPTPEADAPGEAKVTVIVRWKSHENIGAREIVVVEYIRDWATALNI